MGRHSEGVTVKDMLLDRPKIPGWEKALHTLCYGGFSRHQKADLPEVYKPFAGNIMENQARTRRLSHMTSHSAIAAAVMQLSGGNWALEWRE